MRRTQLIQYILITGLLITGVIGGILHPSALIFLFVLWIVMFLINKFADRYRQK
ncbi:MAG TPA: hypothetical protein QF762_01465 [Acidimicrobiales bacterium]|nr:hypothetical protein [Acidimicrobiales bacterium]